MKGRLFSVTMLLVSCAPARGPVYQEDRYPALGLEAQAASVRILDARPSLDSLPSPLPRGRSDYAKSLSPRDSAVLLAQVRRNLTGTGVPLHLEVEVEQADLAVDAGLFRSREAGRTKLRIRFQHGRARLAECTGTATLERRDARARAETLADLFAEGLAMAVHGCLESTKEELKKNFQGAPGRERI